eukprot:GHVQ01016623.1.p1 GENE.GHVQ01016623.1~~GHVQ01016623.1.p1  ORF type:complete len:108 (-),score=5.59 GHVQ01016623.1:218-541(-)
MYYICAIYVYVCTYMYIYIYHIQRQTNAHTHIHECIVYYGSVSYLHNIFYKNRKAMKWNVGRDIVCKRRRLRWIENDNRMSSETAESSPAGCDKTILLLADVCCSDH